MSECSEAANEYYDAYGFHIHSLMLRDKVRVEAYRQAIFNSPALFENKIIMDVGAGSGILSLFCAEAGARKVYAVEASSHMADVIMRCAADNGFLHVITVIEAEVENLSSVANLALESVDVIISEWMGFFLFHEGMLDSILSARKYLKKDGKMFPDKCTMQAALCELPEYNEWGDFCGFDMSAFGQKLREASQSQPQIHCINEKNLLSKPTDLFSFDVKLMEEDDTKQFIGEFIIPASRDGLYQGVCIWFTVTFPSSSGNITTLSTSPHASETHWKQAVIVFNESLTIQESEPVGFEIDFQKVGRRKYQINFSHGDPAIMQHPVPCDCYSTICMVVKAFSISHPVQDSGSADYDAMLENATKNLSIRD